MSISIQRVKLKTDGSSYSLNFKTSLGKIVDRSSRNLSSEEQVLWDAYKATMLPEEVIAATGRLCVFSCSFVCVCLFLSDCPVSEDGD